MKSYIKKNDILEYILSKFNSDNATQDITFVMGSEGMPLYKPISFEGTNGTPDEYEFFDNSTYELTKTQAIPLSIPIIESEYANLKTIDETKRLNSATWSVAVSFLVFANSYVHNKLVFGIEEFRDKILGQTDILNVKQWDYDNPSTVPAWSNYTVVVATNDLVPGELLTINGDIYLEYSMVIDLDVTEGIDYGNQYEFYAALLTDGEGGYNYERLLPIQVSWGTSNVMKANQLLRNETAIASASEHEANRYKSLHNLVDNKGFTLSMTLIKTNETLGTPSIVDNLFEQTYNFFTPMNKPYQIQMKYRPVTGSAGDKTFGTAVEKFSYAMVVMEAETSMVHGDDITFNITLVPSWNQVVELG